MKDKKVTTRVRNQLAMHRKRRLMTPKMVASALGQGSTVQISRYERGVTIPPLDVAIKLGVIYDIPIRILFDGYFEQCLLELGNCNGAVSDNAAVTDKKRRDDASGFCSYEPKLKEQCVSGTELPKYLDTLLP